LKLWKYGEKRSFSNLSDLDSVNETLAIFAWDCAVSSVLFSQSSHSTDECMSSKCSWIIGSNEMAATNRKPAAKVIIFLLNFSYFILML